MVIIISNGKQQPFNTIRHDVWCSYSRTPEQIAYFVIWFSPTIYFRLNFFSTWYCFFRLCFGLHPVTAAAAAALPFYNVIVRLKWLLLLLLQNVLWCLTDFMSSRCYDDDGWHAHRQKLDVNWRARRGNIRRRTHIVL